VRADIHSHLLWGIDDGSRDEAQTRALLSALQAQGKRFLALTPHCDPAHAPMDEFLEKRERAYRRILALPETAGLTLSLGAELYLTDAIFNYEDARALCYTGTDLLLTELQYAERFTGPAEKRLFRLADEFGVRPVLAHVDRYRFFMKDPALLEELAQAGFLLQWNISSAMGFFGRRRFRRFYEKGLVHFLGEDIHRSVQDADKRREELEKLSARLPDLFTCADCLAEEEIFRPCK
jgi:protein-tyrosine phosphatase